MVARMAPYGAALGKGRASMAQAAASRAINCRHAAQHEGGA